MKQTNRKSINPLSFPLLPSLSRAEKWNRKLWPLNVVSYEFQILAFNYCQLSNTFISLICFVFTVTGRGILYSFFVNFIAFGRTIGTNETKQFTLAIVMFSVMGNSLWLCESWCRVTWLQHCVCISLSW